MKREIVKVAACGMITVCMTVSSGLTSLAADAQSETQRLITQLDNKASTDITEASEKNQEWYNKALANTTVETPIYQASADNSEVVGKMYENTIVNVVEKGEEWSKISSGKVTGYVKNDLLSFGLNAVERVETVCPQKTRMIDGKEITYRETQDAKPMEQIVAEEAARKAAAEAKRKAEEEARRKAEEEARRKAAEEAARKKAAARKKRASSPSMSASVDDRTLLAAIIQCEAGGEPYEGKVAVGAVILNRVRSGRYPNSISGVIYQRGQFGPARTGKLARVLSAGRISSACYQAADAALAGSNPIGSAMHFGNGRTGQRIGNHFFH